MKYTKKRFGWHLAVVGLAIAAAGAVLVVKAKKEEHHGCCH
jgi:hypothetical protein